MQVSGGGGAEPAATSITVSGQRLTFVGAEAESAAQRLENVAKILTGTSVETATLKTMRAAGGEELSAMAVRNFGLSVGSASDVITAAINEIFAAVANLRATSSAYSTQDGDL